MWIRIDNQDVGSEAAIIERVRNSSLVKWICAENSAGLKLGTEYGLRYAYPEMDSEQTNSNGN